VHTPGGVDVIVPVFGAGAAFDRCATTLRRYTDLDRNRILVIVDGPQDPETAEAVAELAESPSGVVALQNPRRQGFVASVNRGLRSSERDVVLLNSDTLVTARWLEKLSAAAFSHPRVATVTPFSNNATICSLPRFLAENTVPAGHDVDSFAALVEGCAAREYPELPTGVGVCLFIKRSVLDEVGLLDEEGFGLGYGEETEWCFRASKAGYRHVLDDSTYIFHEGQRSFGVSRRRRVKLAQRVVLRRHPMYLSTIADFIRRDPLEPVRRRVMAALDPCRPGSSGKRPPGVLHVVHGWSPWAHGGTELYAKWLGARQVQNREVAVYARIEDPDRLLGEAKEHFDHGMRVRLVVNNFAQRNPVSRNALHSTVLARDFARLLDEVRPGVIHFHHLAGHCASLLHVARRRGVPIVLQLQDWWPICHRVNLFHRNGTLCTGPSPLKCSNCLPMTRLPGHALWNPLLYAGRATMFHTLLPKVDALVMGSRFIHDTYRHWGFLPSGVPIHVVPYGIETAGASRAREEELRPGGRVRFGYLGSLLPHKGVHLAIQAFEGIDPDRATLDVWGRPWRSRRPE
jgi:GT2 family glycosyltransferase